MTWCLTFLQDNLQRKYLFWVFCCHVANDSWGILGNFSCSLVSSLPLKTYRSGTTVHLWLDSSNWGPQMWNWISSENLVLKCKEKTNESTALKYLTHFCIYVKISKFCLFKDWNRKCLCLNNKKLSLSKAKNSTVNNYPDGHITTFIRIFHIKLQMSTRAKFWGLPNLAWFMHSHQSNSCWDISVQTKVVAIPRATSLARLKLTFYFLVNTS